MCSDLENILINTMVAEGNIATAACAEADLASEIHIS